MVLGEGRVPLVTRNVTSPRSVRKCRLHPLIHTLLEFNVAQSVAHSLCEIASGFVERVGGEAGKVVIK